MMRILIGIPICAIIVVFTVFSKKMKLSDISIYSPARAQDYIKITVFVNDNTVNIVRNSVTINFSKAMKVFKRFSYGLDLFRYIRTIVFRGFCRRDCP